MKIYISKYISNNFLINSRINLIDGGALDGLKKPWKYIENYINVIGFEPQISDSNTEGYQRTIRQSRSRQMLDSVALASEKKDKAPFYLTSHSDNSSLLKPKQSNINQFSFKDRFKIVNTFFVDTDTLDNQLNKRGVSRVDFLKLDTQGTELDILLGAKHTLPNVLGVEVEVNFLERYEGQNSFADIDSFLRKNDFDIIDLERRFAKRNNKYVKDNKKGQLTHGTALYFKKPEKILENISLYSSEQQTTTIIHFIILCILYGYNDIAEYAVSVFEHLLKLDTKEEVLYLIQKNDKSKFVWRGSFKLYTFFLKLASFFKPHTKSGINGDSGLGNT